MHDRPRLAFMQRDHERNVSDGMKGAIRGTCHIRWVTALSSTVTGGPSALLGLTTADKSNTMIIDDMYAWCPNDNMIHM